MSPLDLLATSERWAELLGHMLCGLTLSEAALVMGITELRAAGLRDELLASVRRLC